jgi:hypothetical protein
MSISGGLRSCLTGVLPESARPAGEIANEKSSPRRRGFLIAPMANP